MRNGTTVRARLLFYVFGLIIAQANASEMEIGFSVIHTAHSAGAQEAMVVNSGSWWVRRELVQTAVLIQHPKGDVLIDTGLGRNIDKQFSENGWVDRHLFEYADVYPTVDQFRDNGYDTNRLKRIIPTHLHWDHASGLEDFPNVPVWVQEAEYQEAIHGEAPTHLSSQFTSVPIDWQFLELREHPYLGYSKSLDVYDDGSIVLVDLSGHSAGQVGIFLTTTSGKQYFFIGDTTWTLKGVIDDAPRPKLIKWLVNVNWNEQKNVEAIHQLHQLSTEYSNIKVVPAHDERVMAELPKYPMFSY